jgi:hypothetical protein
MLDVNGMNKRELIEEDLDREDERQERILQVMTFPQTKWPTLQHIVFPVGIIYTSPSLSAENIP